MVVSCLLAGSGFAVDYYVANQGNDNNDGISYSTAWRTIDKINISSFQPGDSIQFRCGDEWREQLNVSNSGVSGSPITFTSFGTDCNLANRPVLSAYEVITGWSQYSQNIYMASVTSDVKQLFINGLYVKLAQHPDYQHPHDSRFRIVGPDPADPQGKVNYQSAAYIFNTGLAGSLASMCQNNFSSAGIHIKTQNYLIEGREVSGFNPISGRLSLSIPTLNTPKQNFGYYLDNKLCLLDSAGEWYYNPAEQKLYLWLPDNGDPNALDEYNEPVYRIEASIRDYGVRTVPKSYIRIAGTSQYFVSLQEAYDSALHLDSIRSQSEVLAGNIIFDRPVSVTRKGGYDCGYTGKIGDMVLQGNIAVNDGTVTIGGFVLQ